MILIKRILILEDNLVVLSKILAKLAILEQDQPFELSLVILTDHEQVEDYVNKNPKAKFDIILLDRDCKLNGSFHVLDIERFGVEKVIAISSVPKFNQQIQERGVTKVIEKDMLHMDEFIDQVIKTIEELISKMPWRSE
ncbi:MAG: hypothetical protein Q8Q96_00220 [bacterium]|nr:hypothetical protein [bacterium]